MTVPCFEPLRGYREHSPEEMVRRAAAFADSLQRRRTVRHFSDKPVPREAIEHCLSAANSAPSGANLKPWHFVVVTDREIRRRIREAAEHEEREFYSHRAPREWLAVLAPLGTDSVKEFLEVAPYLIAIFAQRYGVAPDGARRKHYYVPESVGIATGLLIAAVHQAGLASLTHTPSPMGFLNEILERPKSESPYLLLVVGHPAPDARVPAISRREWQQSVSFR